MLRGSPAVAVLLSSNPRARAGATAASASLRDRSVRLPFPLMDRETHTNAHAPAQEPEPEQEQDKLYFHYNHTVPSRFARWTARQSYEFMYDRPWQHVLDLYSKLVNGKESLPAMFGTETYSVPDDTAIPEVYDEMESEGIAAKDKSGRWARATFKIVLSYHGGSFDGWQKQPGLNTVQGLVEISLGRFVDERKAQLLKENCKPLEGCSVVAGRTDKGVSALRQVCSFYTWRQDVKPYEVEDAINLAAPGKLRVVSVSEVSRSFHPNFSAKWRRYIYFFPLIDGENGEECSEKEDDVEMFDSNKTYGELSDGHDEDEFESKRVPRRFSVSKVNQLLRQLEGKLLSYRLFARDTKASRSIGPPTECFMYHARATVVRLPCSDCEKGKEVMCIELVANRFLRRMVRVLVATSIREAAAVAEDDVLLKLMDATCRRATAPPAPPDGLCLADVGYTDFNPQNCLIH